ncbi:ead/Ea22-like family protein [Escherichia coli]
MTIDYQVLREAAEKATPDEWVAFISTDTGTYAVHTPGDERCEDVIKWTGFDGQKNAENNARYVAAFNPKVALELLGEIKRLEDTNIDAMCRIAELETNLAALAAENARCLFEVSRCHQTVDEMFHHKDKWFDKEWLSALWSTSKRLMENTPATDAFLSELRAQGVEMFSEKFGGGTPLSNMVKEVAADFAAKLRKGGNQ